MSDDNNTTAVTLRDSLGGSHDDTNQLAGDPLETTSYDFSGGPVTGSTINSYWVSAAAATRTRTGLPALTANATGQVEEFTRTALNPGPSATWRDTETDTSYYASADLAVLRPAAVHLPARRPVPVRQQPGPLHHHRLRAAVRHREHRRPPAAGRDRRRPVRRVQPGRRQRPHQRRGQRAHRPGIGVPPGRRGLRHSAPSTTRASAPPRPRPRPRRPARPPRRPRATPPRSTSPAATPAARSPTSSRPPPPTTRPAASPAAGTASST